jgi:hypothetical protein
MTPDFMGSLGGQLIIGLVSGLLSSFVAWLFYRFANDSVIPWYQRRFYRGLIVQGAWQGERNDGGHLYGFHFDLAQSGHEVTGIFNANNTKPDGTKTNKNYLLSGEIANNSVLLNYAPSDQSSYGSGSFLFQVFDAGRTLKGGMLYLRTKSGNIGCVDDLCLSRTNA